MEGAAEEKKQEEDVYEQNFIAQPAILDKHKAAADIC